jgi:hypothetical protein
MDAKKATLPVLADRFCLLADLFVGGSLVP